MLGMKGAKGSYVRMLWLALFGAGIAMAAQSGPALASTVLAGGAVGTVLGFLLPLILGQTVTAYAANDPLVVVNNLSTFIFGLIRAVGLILLGWGIVQVGLSLQSHDPSQRSNGFLTLAGGIIITFAKEILDLIVA